MVLAHVSDVSWKVVASQAPLTADAAPLVVPVLCAQPNDPDRLWWPDAGTSAMVHVIGRARAQEEFDDGNWSWLDVPLPWRPGMVYLFTGREPLIELRESELMSKLRELAREALCAADVATVPSERLRELERAARADLDDAAIRLAMLAAARENQVSSAVLSLLRDRVRQLSEVALSKAYLRLERECPSLAGQVRDDPDGRRYAGAPRSKPQGLGADFLRTMRTMRP